MKKYKLVDQEGYTRRGDAGETYWLDGKEKVAKGPGMELCSNDVIHYYDHPALAIIFNPIHAGLKNPRVIEIEIDKEVIYDGLKGGCKKAKYLCEIAIPQISLEQKVKFAIVCSLEVYREKSYVAWAQDWLNKKNRTVSAAWAASAVSDACAESAESAAESAEMRSFFIETIESILKGE